MANEADKPAQVPAEEAKKEALVAILSTPAVFANRSFVTRLPLGVRISFTENTPELDGEWARSAVFLPLPEALSLRDVLIQTLGDIKIEAQAEAPEAEKPA